MSNSYYVASGEPGTGAFAASAPMRTEFSSIEDGFDLLPTLTANKAVVVNSAGTALVVTTGSLALAGNFTTTGAFAVVLAASAAVTLTLPAVDGTLATLAGTETFSNKTFGSNVALGTPASGVATNLTGTAAGLTAGTVTTNANLGGPITSVGNTTSVAAQTGTGSTFVMQASPTLNSPVLVTAALGTPASGNLSNCTALPASGITTGQLAVARGGTGVDASAATNGQLLIGNGTGFTLASLTAGTNISITPGAGSISIAATGSVDYAQVGTNTISGTPTSVVFTSLTSEDIILYVSNVAITAGTAQLQLELSIDNGSSYLSSVINLGSGTGLSTTGRYGVFPGTGFKIGKGSVDAPDVAGALSTSGPSRTQILVSTIYTFYTASAVNAIRISTSASTFVNGGIFTLYGRG